MSGGSGPIIFGLAAATGVAFLLIYFLVREVSGGSSRVLRQRVSNLQHRGQRRDPKEKTQKHASLRRDRQDGPFRQLDVLARRVLPRPGALRDRLIRTGYNITLGQYLFGCLAIAVGFTVIRMLFYDMPMILSVLFSIVTGVGVPHFTVTFLIKRRQKQFNSQFAEAIDLIVRGLKSGLPPTESMRVVGTEFKDPIGVEFRNISDGIRLGQDMEEALWAAVDRIDTPEFRFFAISLSVQRETGGNLAEALSNLSDILRKRRQMQLKIKAMSSEARASAMILGSLPFVMFGILYMLNEPYVMKLFGDPRGILMVVVGLTSLFTGCAVMAKMARFEI